MTMNASRNDTIRGLWDELNQGLFPWIDDNIGDLADAAYDAESIREACAELGTVAVEQMLRMLCSPLN